MMVDYPTLRTRRLILRAFTLADALVVQRLAGDRDLASTIANIPHPYEDGMAETWIAAHHERLEQGLAVIFAITLASSGELVGAVGLEINREHGRAELGYWVSKPYWNQCTCTEAARGVLRMGFDELALEQIYAMHFKRNPASGRVMQKIGMRREGTMRRHLLK